MSRLDFLILPLRSSAICPVYPCPSLLTWTICSLRSCCHGVSWIIQRSIYRHIEKKNIPQTYLIPFRYCLIPSFHLCLQLACLSAREDNHSDALENLGQAQQVKILDFFPVFSPLYFQFFPIRSLSSARHMILKTLLRVYPAFLFSYFFFSSFSQICEREHLLCELMRINSLIGISRGYLALNDHIDHLAAVCIKRSEGSII